MDASFAKSLGLMVMCMGAPSVAFAQSPSMFAHTRPPVILQGSIEPVPEEVRALGAAGSSGIGEGVVDAGQGQSVEPAEKSLLTRFPIRRIMWSSPKSVPEPSPEPVNEDSATSPGFWGASFAKFFPAKSELLVPEEPSPASEFPPPDVLIEPPSLGGLTPNTECAPPFPCDEPQEVTPSSTDCAPKFRMPHFKRIFRME